MTKKLEKLSKTLQNFTEFFRKLYEKGRNPENFTKNFQKRLHFFVNLFGRLQNMLYLCGRIKGLKSVRKNGVQLERCTHKLKTK